MKCPEGHQPNVILNTSCQIGIHVDPPILQMSIGLGKQLGFGAIMPKNLPGHLSKTKQNKHVTFSWEC